MWSPSPFSHFRRPPLPFHGVGLCAGNGRVSRKPAAAVLDYPSTIV